PTYGRCRNKRCFVDRRADASRHARETDRQQKFASSRITFNCVFISRCRAYSGLVARVDKQTQDNIAECLMGKRQLARFLGVSEGTVTRMVINGTGPRYHRVGLFVRFAMNDVRSWLETRAVNPKEAA